MKHARRHVLWLAAIALLACKSSKTTARAPGADAAARPFAEAPVPAGSPAVRPARSPAEVAAMARSAGWVYVPDNTGTGHGRWMGPDAAVGACVWGPDALALPPPVIGETCDERACNAAGGLCSYGGIGCPSMCARRTGDANKRCTDSSQCEAGCLAPEGTPPGQAVVGACRAYLSGFGCANIVEKGIARGVACAD